MKNKHTLSTAKLHVRRGDKVRLIAGNDKGKEGRILQIHPKLRRAVVEGCRMVKKHKKPDANHPSGQIEEKEASIHTSNLMLLDPVKGVPSRIGRRRDKQQKLKRYAKKSGEFFPQGT